MSPSLSARLLLGYLALALIFQHVLTARATQVVPDGSSRTSLARSGGGVQVVNVAPPSPAGVSHNRYSRYDVSGQGLILNNSGLGTYNPASSSALGGHVELNPNMGHGPQARVILNEVTGGSVSELRGPTEIFGERADLVLANPNGITCAGCGFINTGRLSLITGSPAMTPEGAIKDFALSPQGVLRIEGAGAAAQGLEHGGSAELVSNLVRVAGSVKVTGDLSIATGNDRYDPATGAVSSTAAQGTPMLALDSTALGGMHAGSIRIFASQKGFGINAQGGVSAGTAGLRISAEGDIVLKDASSAGDMGVSSRGGNLRDDGGEWRAAGDMGLVAPGELRLTGAVRAGGGLAAEAGRVRLEPGAALGAEELRLSSRGDLENAGHAAGAKARLEAQGRLSNTGRVEARELRLVSGGDLVNAGQAESENMTLESQGALTNTGLLAAEHMALAAQGALSNTGQAEAGDMSLAGSSVNNSGRIYAERDLDLRVREGLENQAAGVLAAGGDIRLESGGATRNMGRIAAGGALSSVSASMHNYGQLSAAGQAEFETAEDFINYAQAGVLAGRELTLRTGRNFINYMGEVFAVGEITFTGLPGALGWGGAVNPDAVYANPYAQNQPPVTEPPVTPPPPTPPAQDPQEEVPPYVEVYLPEADKILLLPVDLFFETHAAQTEVTLEDGFILRFTDAEENFVIVRLEPAPPAPP
ncbi:MAG: filamentous hemagglutinin N-terminal domain-containing protein, partial [Deltaproteobacteria bacterium]|nr:filamentous hemagglutinin N-terminal domain-containing protein [Deltaproteobacteria bacterium]